MSSSREPDDHDMLAAVYCYLFLLVLKVEKTLFMVDDEMFSPKTIAANLRSSDVV